jgi:hypothetical protein
MRTGRQTKLTPQVQEQLCQAVALGVSVTSAAAYLGIGKSAILEWLQRGQGCHPSRGRTSLYADFVESIEKARAQDELRRMGRLEQAARGGQVVSEKITRYGDGREVIERQYTRPEWTADAWVLERTRPDQYGRRDRLAVQLQIEAVAARVAAELGLRTEDVLEEAQLLLKEMDYEELPRPTAG